MTNIINDLVDTAISYVPDTETNKSGYVKTVWEQILGKDKEGKPRPFEDLIYFLQVCKNTGLNPTIRQIYGVYRWDSRLGKERMTIQTGIDGLRSIAERTGNYGGSSDVVFEYLPDDTVKLKPIKATIKIYKLIQGMMFETQASAYWKEYYPGDSQGMMWNKMPHVMLSKVCEGLALRKAFPVCAQIYIEEEMQQSKQLTISKPKEEVKKLTSEEIKLKSEEIKNRMKGK
jgi:phage recombination protein Bet